jgi:hypothetical protein
MRERLHIHFLDDLWRLIQIGSKHKGISRRCIRSVRAEGAANRRIAFCIESYVVRNGHYQLFFLSRKLLENLVLHKLNIRNTRMLR